MKRSDTLKEFAPAFVVAQKSMRAAAKDSKNPHFNSSYSDFESVVEAVRGPLNDSGIFYMQPVHTTEAGVEVETILMHASGEWVSEVLVIPLQKWDAQAIGSATSYGKRYALQSICGIPSADDDGNAATGDRAKAPARPAPATRPPAKPAPEAKAPEKPAPPAKPTIGFDPFKDLTEEANDFLVNVWDVKVAQRQHSVEAGREYLKMVLLKKGMKSVNQIGTDDQVTILQKVESGDLDAGISKHEGAAATVAA